MKKSQIKMLALSMSVASLIASTSAVHAGDYKGYKDYKSCEGPCPPWVLYDGLYIGAAAGYDSYRAVDDVTEDGFIVNPPAGIAYSEDPALSANGIVGGLFGGYGKYFDRYQYRGVIPYLAFELFLNGSSASSEDVEFSVKTPPSDGVQHIFRTKFTGKTNFGLSLLPGIKISDYTLFYVRLGYNWSEMSMTEEFINTDGPTGRNGRSHLPIEIDDGDDVIQGGFNYGVGIESAFYYNLSARLEFTHTDYGSFDTNSGSEVSVADNQLMLGIIYHFNFPKLFHGWNP